MFPQAPVSNKRLFFSRVCSCKNVMPNCLCFKCFPQHFYGVARALWADLSKLFFQSKEPNTKVL